MEHEISKEELKEILKARREGRLFIAPCRLGESAYKVVIKNHETSPNSPWFAYVKKCKLAKSNLLDMCLGHGKTTFLSHEKACEVLESIKRSMKNV